MNGSEVLDDLLHAIPTLHDRHAPGSHLYRVLKATARREVEPLFAEGCDGPVAFGPFGELTLPYHRMGAIDSLNLFDLDELILFSFYWTNRKRYKRVLDIGANLGLHSILLHKCGYTVTSYEPDPVHFEILKRNLDLNGADHVEAVNMAVAGRAGSMEFVRVVGNTTSSHLAGAKTNPYGDLDRFPVTVTAFTDIVADVDLVKMDVEGQEKDILLTTSRAEWEIMDGFVEIENHDNALAVYDHLSALGVNMFSQKRNWDRVQSIEDVPAGYREGTLFVSCQDSMPW